MPRTQIVHLNRQRWYNKNPTIRLIAATTPQLNAAAKYSLPSIAPTPSVTTAPATKLLTSAIIAAVVPSNEAILPWT